VTTCIIYRLFVIIQKGKIVEYNVVLIFHDVKPIESNDMRSGNSI